MFYAAGVNDAVMAMPSSEFAQDKPSYRPRALDRSSGSAQWIASMPICDQPQRVH